MSMRVYIETTIPSFYHTLRTAAESVETTQMADEVIREVRRIRHEISRRCDHDVHKVVACYRAFQDELKRSGEYRFFQRGESDDAATPESDSCNRAGT